MSTAASEPLSPHLGCEMHHGFHINLCPDCAKRASLATVRQEMRALRRYLSTDDIAAYVESVLREP